MPWRCQERFHSCGIGSWLNRASLLLNSVCPAAHYPPTEQDLRAKLLLLSDGDGQRLVQLTDDNTSLRRELAARERTCAELEHRLAASHKLQLAGASSGALGLGMGMGGSEAAMQRATSIPMPAAPAVTLTLGGSMSLPMGGTVQQGAGLPVPTIVSVPAQQPQLMVAQLAPAAPMGGLQQQQGMAGMPATAADAAAAAVAAQQQVMAGVQPGAQMVVSMAPQAGQQVLLQAAGGGVPTLAQPTGTTLSGGTLAAAAANPARTVMSDGFSGEAAPAAGMQQMVAAMPTSTVLSGPGESGAGVADAAAQNLNQQAQQLTVQASLHGQARTQATSQAQQLASQAQMHAQASVQAAVQAEQLKQTLAGGWWVCMLWAGCELPNEGGGWFVAGIAGAVRQAGIIAYHLLYPTDRHGPHPPLFPSHCLTAVLPDNQQAHEAVATVQNLEERAKAHADITTQVWWGSAGVW